MQRIALITAGTVFGLLATSHIVRWVSPVEILIEGNVLPLIVSVSSGIILALLSIWMFVAVKKMGSIPEGDKEEEENN